VANNGNLIPWKKGQSGNPKGKPKRDPDVIAATKLTRENVERAISKYLKCSYEDLKKLIAEKKGQNVELIIARIIEKAISSADYQGMNFLLDRLIGKVKDKVEVTKHEPVIIEMKSGDQIYMNSHTREESEDE
jgi:hypothetical protein